MNMSCFGRASAFNKLQSKKEEKRKKRKRKVRQNRVGCVWKSITVAVTCVVDDEKTANGSNNLLKHVSRV